MYIFFVQAYSYNGDNMKYWIYFLCGMFVISTFFACTNNEYSESVKSSNTETRAVYFSYIEFDNYLKGKSDEEQKENIIEVLDNIKSIDFNKIILHVRAFSDSIYKSDYYPISKSVLNDKGEYPSYDVLEFFIKESHKRDILVDAWINPYRISNLKDVSKLSSDSIYFKYPDSKVTEKGIYLNPANKDVQELIVKGIVEIVKKYDVDGIHFDDYFYPDKEIDLNSFNEYIKNGGKKSINEYRYDNVKTLIKNVYSSIKKENKNVLFGISPEGNIDNCLNNSYLDVNELLSNDGYIDYIMPQIYFGFFNQTRPFKETLDKWSNLIKVDSIKLIPALAFYKSGNIDKYALSGSDEWINNSDIISRQIILSRNNDKYNGFSLFSYNYLFNDNYKNDNNIKELENLKKLLKEDTN